MYARGPNPSRTVRVLSVLQTCERDDCVLPTRSDIRVNRPVIGLWTTACRRRRISRDILANCSFFSFLTVILYTSRLNGQGMAIKKKPIARTQTFFAFRFGNGWVCSNIKANGAGSVLAVLTFPGLMCYVRVRLGQDGWRFICDSGLEPRATVLNRNAHGRGKDATSRSDRTVYNWHFIRN